MNAIYIGGTLPPTLPLARYLPAQPAGVFAHWLKEHVPAGSLVLDPLCAHPWTAIEAARAGYRVIACCNNPVLVFLLEMLASAPSRLQFQSALAELAAARRNDVRLEQQLQELYLTGCPNCNRLVPAEAYIWQSGAEYPSARLLHCPHCETEGELNITPGDITRYAQIGSDTLHRTRALQRVATPADDYYENALSALEVYAKRPLYVIFTILNKIDSLSMPDEEKRLLHALLLPVLDQGNTLWQHPPLRARPRQLSTPPLVRENNLWLALENAIDLWTVLNEPIPIQRMPTLPQPGEISILAGRFRHLFPLPENAGLQSVVTSLPRPGQAFWTLCALWSGWLWGRKAVTPLRSALQRLRYDWNWHARALKSTFQTLGEQIPDNTSIFACAPEMEPGFLTAALVAASAGGLQVNALALREEADILQVDWRRRSPGKQSRSARLAGQMRQGMTAHLAQRGEPAPYLTLLAAALEGADFSSVASDDAEGLPHNYIGQVQTNFREVLRAPAFLPAGSDANENPESVQWYAANTEIGNLATRFDRMERCLVQYLIDHDLAALPDIEAALFAELPGLNTPTPSEIALLLESYGEPHARVQRNWQLKEKEHPAVRRHDVQSAVRDLATLGERLKYHVSGEMPMLWSDADGQSEYCFHILASSIVSTVVYQKPLPAASQRVIVLPGSRCNLLSYKLKEDPRLDKAFSGWHTLKFRNLRNIAKRDDLTRAIWTQLLDADPPCWEEATQISIFPESGALPLFPSL